MSPNDLTFWDAVDEIRDREPRYRREAYAFLMAALGAIVEELPDERRADPERRHLSGQELLRGMVALARREFGIMAPTVFREWGVERGEDVGAMVFHLVEARQLSARSEDSIADFAGGPDLMAALTAGLDLGTPPAPPTESRPPKPSGSGPGASP